MDVTLKRIIDRLRQVKNSGEGYSALCPAHEDHENSLSIGLGDNEQILLKCFAGCTTERVVAAMNLSMRDLYPDSQSSKRIPIRVEDLARDKALPLDFLASLGIEDRNDGVAIPYYLENGALAQRQRLRTALAAKDGSIWIISKGRVVPYGLNRLGVARSAGFVVLVEGESDCWTLWFHGIPALGIPGATMANKLETNQIESVPRIYVVEEPDHGGSCFVSGVSRRLAALKWGGSAYRVKLVGAKDPNDLHQQDPDAFKTAFVAAMDAAERLDLDADWSSTGAKHSEVVSPVETVLSEKQSQADMLIELVEEAGVELFTDLTNGAWARMEVNGHHEVHRCRSKRFRQFVARLSWERKHKAPNSNALVSAMNVIEAKASYEGNRHQLHNRVALHDGAIWYDLTDSEWRVVRITPDSWKIVSRPPILFRRYAHQQPQVEPKGGGDLKQLFDFVHLKMPEQRLLFEVYVVSCLVPGIPHPIPTLHGPQGSTKTSALRCGRKIVDPSATETLSLPHNRTELVQQLSHHWMPVYDNVTAIPVSVSDALCRASTGEGFSKRELYSDDDDIIYSFRCCCGLNGINVAAYKPDLLDRCLLFGFKRLPRSERRRESELWAEFDRIRPHLVGAALDALSRAMEIQPQLQLRELPRMADFASWGEAISQALGHPADKFLEAYEGNYRQRNEEVLVNDPLASTLLAFVEKRGDWEGSASELLAALVEIAGQQNVDVRSKPWPKAAHGLTRRLNEITTNLAAVGVIVSTGGRISGGRTIRIEKVPGESVISVTPDATPSASTVSDDAIDDALNSKASPQSLFSGESDANDANDAFSRSSSPRQPEPRSIPGTGGPQPEAPRRPSLPGAEREEFDL